MKRRGFTLIELLVVIAIIAILAAILFPVFARARENARKATCLNNLKQIGMGIMMYVQDYDERYPPNRQGIGGSGACSDSTRTGTWRTSIEPYVKNWQVFYCPSNRCDGGNPEEKRLGGAGNPAKYANLKNFHYHYNGSVMCVGNGGSKKLTDFERPAQQIIVHENRICPPDAGGWCWTSLGENYHMGGKNWLFGDGHAKWMKPTQVCAPINMWVSTDPPKSPYDYTCSDTWTLNEQ